MARHDDAAATRVARENSLRLSPRQIDELLARLDAGTGQAVDREYARFPFRRDAVPVRVEQPGGRAAVMHVVCRNISRTGLSFLHCAYVHADQRCAIGLVTLDRQAVRLPGTIVRCTHRFDSVHEVGVRFDEPVDVRRFLASNPLDPAFSVEKVDASQITGRLLHVESWEFDRQVMRHHLRETRVRIVDAESVEAVRTRLDDTYDLVICAYNLEDGSAEDVVLMLREQGLAAPVIVMTGDSGDMLRSRIAELGPDAVLIKPVPQNLLLRAVAEYMVLPRQESDAGASSGGVRVQSAELIKAFKSYLPAQRERLQKAIDEGDAERCLLVCTELRASSATLGFSQIEQAARDAAIVLERTRRVTDAQAALASVLATTQRIAGR